MKKPSPADSMDFGRDAARQVSTRPRSACEMRFKVPSFPLVLFRAAGAFASGARASRQSGREGRKASGKNVGGLQRRPQGREGCGRRVKFGGGRRASGGCFCRWGRCLVARLARESHFQNTRSEVRSDRVRSRRQCVTSALDEADDRQHDGQHEEHEQQGPAHRGAIPAMTGAEQISDDGDDEEHQGPPH